MRATRSLNEKLQDGNKIASPDRAIRSDWGCRWWVTVVRLGGSIFFATGREPERAFNGYIRCRSLSER
jgi:hypothetical protein